MCQMGFVDLRTLVKRVDGNLHSHYYVADIKYLLIYFGEDEIKKNKSRLIKCFFRYSLAGIWADPFCHYFLVLFFCKAKFRAVIVFTLSLPLLFLFYVNDVVGDGLFLCCWPASQPGSQHESDMAWKITTFDKWPWKAFICRHVRDLF